MTAPCKDCPDRHYKCHSECEKYKAFIAENEKRKSCMRAENDLLGMDIGRLKHLNNNRRKR